MVAFDYYVTQVLKSVDCPDKPEIVPGLELVALNGEYIEGVPFQDALARLKSAGRPLTLTFVRSAGAGQFQEDDVEEIQTTGNPLSSGGGDEQDFSAWADDPDEPVAVPQPVAAQMSQMSQMPDEPVAAREMVPAGAPPAMIAVESALPMSDADKGGDDRESWGKRIEFLLSCLGYCVGVRACARACARPEGAAVTDGRLCCARSSGTCAGFHTAARRTEEAPSSSRMRSACL